MNNRTVSLLSGAGLLLAACIWGFAFVVVKDSLDFIGPVYMIAFRFSAATLALGIIFSPRLKNINRVYWKNGAVLGAFLFLAYAFQTIGCGYTTAGKKRS